MRVIVFERLDKGISIISPNKKTAIKNCIHSVPEGLEYKIVDSSELQQDREFRNAWNYDLSIDIPKAKEIQKDRLRAEREKAFKVNDDKRAVAVRRGEPVEEIDKEAERLCDIPQLVDACKTLEEIKAVKI